jgi:hypothetical protein
MGSQACPFGKIEEQERRARAAACRPACSRGVAMSESVECMELPLADIRVIDLTVARASLARGNRSAAAGTAATSSSCTGTKSRCPWT